MGFLRRIFDAASASTPSEPVEVDGHVHAPDADPETVVLPKTRKSGRSLTAGKPPRGWRRHASQASGGDSPGGHDFGGSGDFGGGGDGGFGGGH